MTQNSAGRGRPSILCVIPTHARPGSLEIALGAVARQSLKPDLVVIVDDVGTAETEALATDFSPTLKVTYLNRSAESQKSAGSSRNAGVAIAGTFDLIAFLDDDDYWHPSYLERMSRIAIEQNSAFVVSWGSMRGPDFFHPHAWHMTEGCTASQVLADNPGITGSNFMIRGSAFEAVGGFDPGQWVFNDLELLVRCLDVGLTYAVIPEDLVTQTVSRGGHLSSPSDQRAEGILRYIGIVDHRLSQAQRRSLLRESHLARLHKEQARLKVIKYIYLVTKNSSVRQMSLAIYKRLRLAKPSYR